MTDTKELQSPAAKKVLSLAQAEALKPLWQTKQNAEEAFQVALTLLGVPKGSTITSGDLSVEQPYLMVIAPEETAG